MNKINPLISCLRRSFGNRLVVVLLLVAIQSAGQDVRYARRIMDTLTSPSFHGRGYVEKGESRAADFIREEFQKIGLRPVGSSYVQEFYHNVNTFPGTIELHADGEKLRPGAQYLIDPSSPPGTGKLKTKTLSLKDILEDNWVEVVKKDRNKILLVDLTGQDGPSQQVARKIGEFSEYLKYEGRVAAKAVGFVHRGKTPWSVSTSQAFRPSFILFADSIEGSLEELTFTIEAEYIENYPSKNVIGYLPGADLNNDSCLVITAHYDHLGRMGRDVYFPGANDNASGVALMLDLARQLKSQPLKYDVFFIAFGAEEAGLLGSNHFVKNPSFPLENIKFLINLDLAGTGVDGVTVVNGSIHKEHFDRLKKLNEEMGLLKEVKARGEACNSDHCFFHLNGVPSFYIYTLGGTVYYHDIYDKADTLPLKEYESYFKLLYVFLGGI